VVFIAVQQGLFGLYMGSSFAPNHKGMPILGAADQSDFLRRQVLTSRNVSGGWLIDNAMGGLNYQVEHHLFPSMPRPNLRRAQALVAAFCHQQDLPYCQSSLAGSYAQVLRHLDTVGRTPRSPRSPALTTYPPPSQATEDVAKATLGRNHGWWYGAIASMTPPAAYWRCAGICTVSRPWSPWTCSPDEAFAAKVPAGQAHGTAGILRSGGLPRPAGPWRRGRR